MAERETTLGMLNFELEEQGRHKGRALKVQTKTSRNEGHVTTSSTAFNCHLPPYSLVTNLDGRKRCHRKTT